jgi:hypothetical protein
MSEHKIVVWFGDDPQPNRFFFRSPFRSWRFIANTIVVIASFLSFGIVPFTQWHSLTGPSSRRLFWGGFMLVVGVLGPYLRALQYHRRINELYLAGKINDQAAESPLNDVLEVADDAINTGLFCISFLVAFLGLGLLFGWVQPN